MSTLEERMATAEQKGRDYFRQGLNCTECILRTFMDMHETNLPSEVLKIASGFGLGMGDTRNTCGAIIGAIMAISAATGKDPMTMELPADRIAQKKNEVYPAVARAIRDLEENYGTLICKELSAPSGDFESRERKKSCQQFIGHCCALAEKYAFENLEG